MAVFDRIAAGGFLNNNRSTAATSRSIAQRTTVVALAFAAVLAACSGGGGDDAGGTPYVPPTQAPQTPGGLTGHVLSASDGQPVANATVTVDGDTITTGADGALSFADLTQVDRLAVTISAPGYARTVRFTPVTNNIITTVPTQLAPVAATASLDAAVGGTAAVGGGSTAQAAVPAAAIVTTGGAAPTVQVLVELAPINPSQDPNLLTGDYRTTNNGAAAWLESYGGLSVVFTDATGGTYNLATGQTATIRIPAATRASALTPTATLFWFDEATGLWVNEGTATLGGTAPNQYYEGTASRPGTWAAGAVINTVQVTGCVANLNGSRVRRARVEVEGLTYTGMSNVLTDNSGNFSVPVRQNSEAAVVARSGARVSNARGVTTTTNTVALGDCLVFADGAVSIKLTWGRNPLDVDSHMLTPQQEHIDYTHKGALTVAPYVNLDIDDVTSFGPEYVTIRRLAQGTYRYYLHNFSNTFGPGMTDSPVKVEVTYDGNTRVFKPGAGEGTLRYWHAFDIVVDAQCAVTITAVDDWSVGAPTNPNPAGAVTYCN